MGNLNKTDYICALALQNYPGNVVIIDANADVVYANEAAAQRLGLPLQDLLTMNYYDIVEKGIVDRSAGVEALETGEQVLRLTKNRKGEGMYITSIPIADAENQTQYICSYSFGTEEIDSYLSWTQSEKNRLLAVMGKVVMQKQRDMKIVAESPRMKSVLNMAATVAPTSAIVLLTGESGSGKEVVAKYIHENSREKNGMFLPVNCAAIPEELAESELFGYEEGAFTGARKKGAMGYFEATKNGTLFLDEVGELSLKIQSKLLRVIENKTYMRVGGRKTIDAKSRIICATNRNLKEMVEEGRFREDLYYRLNVLPLYIPPLRERKEDILPMAEVFLKQYNRKNHVEHVFAPEMKRAMEQYDWPGNVRELRNMVERCSIIAPEFQITPEVMFPGIHLEPDLIENGDVRPLKNVMRDAESRYLTQVLEKCAWDISSAADVLKIHPSGLYKKIKEYGLKQEL